MLLRIIIFLFVLFILEIGVLHAQNDNNLSINTAFLDFVNQYEIDTLNSKICQVLTEVDLRKGPDKTSELLGVKIASGEIVKALKIFPRDASWAILYNGNTGFVPLASLMSMKQDEPLTFFPYDEPPVLQTKFKAEYPPEAMKHKIEGEVVLLVLVSKKGFVDDVKIVSGIPELNQAAVEAIEDLKFKPGKLAGKPVEVWVRIPVKFNYREM